MGMNITESSIQPRTSTVGTNTVGDDAIASQSASLVVDEVAPSYEKFQKAKEELSQNPTLSAQTAFNNAVTELWVAVNNNKNKLSSDALAFYNEAIDSASPPSTSSTFSASSTPATESEVKVAGESTKKSLSEFFIDSMRAERGAASTRLQVMKLIQALGEETENIRTQISKSQESYKGGDATGTEVKFSKLIKALELIIGRNDGRPGLEGQGVIRDENGNVEMFTSKKDAQAYIDKTYGQIARVEAELNVDGEPTGKYFTTLDTKMLKELKELFVKMDDIQNKNATGKKGEFLTPEEHASLETAIRGLFGGWDGNVTMSSTLASQLHQAMNEFGKILSTMMSNLFDAVAKMFSRI